MMAEDTPRGHCLKGQCIETKAQFDALTKEKETWKRELTELLNVSTSPLPLFPLYSLFPTVNFLRVPKYCYCVLPSLCQYYSTHLFIYSSLYSLALVRFGDGNSKDGKELRIFTE